LIINIRYEEKIGRFGSVAGGALFGRQPLQLNRTAEREAESAADQAPLYVGALQATALTLFYEIEE
jgi:hypothetical protein